jgi:hypothetical protein
MYDYTWLYNSSSCVISWAVQTSGTTALLYSVKSINTLVGWAAGAGAVVRKTTDGGVTWTNGNPNTGVITGDIYNLEAVDANTAWCTTSPTASNSYIYRTTNGGTNWVQVLSVGGTNPFIDGIAFADASNGFAYGDPVSARWSLWKTSNGGANWDSTGLYLPQAGSEAGWNNAIIYRGRNILFGTNNTRIYYSPNAGANWVYGTTTGNANSYSLAFNYFQLGLIGGTILQRTTDGGANFVTLTAPGTGNITGLAGIYLNFWYTRGNNIYYSSNSGDNWATAYTGTQALNDIDISTPNCCPKGWAVGANGTIIGLGLVGVNPGDPMVPEAYSLSQNYPNPFNPSTAIHFAIPKDGIVELRVYDVIGREVDVLVNEFRSAGNYSVNFNAGKLASGVYIYKFKSGSYTDTKKMVLIK